jgi:hypothetical protein
MSIPENPTPNTYPPLAPIYRRDSSLAIASLVSGLVAWFFIPVVGAIVAVITGHLAKKEIRDSQGALTGDGMALAGLILGYIQLGLVFLAVVCLITFGLAVTGGTIKSLTGPSALAFFML